MSLYDYECGRELAAQDVPFYAVIQAAMRRADSDSLVLLTRAFPEIWDELNARYAAPGGRLVGDTP